MQKKKFWLWLLSIFMFALSIFSLTACKDGNNDKLYLGTYKGGKDTFVITEEYVNINGENYTYTIVDDKIRIERFSSDLIFRNNYQVLSFEFLAEFDSGSITERNQYFNATLYNYGNGGILEAYTFKSDGTALYVNSSDTTKNKSAAYRIKDGVIEITFMEIVTFQTSKTYWYVTENGQIYYDVYVKDVDTYFNDNGNNDDNNENGSTQTPAIEFYEVTFDYGYEQKEDSIKIQEGGSIQLKVPEREGYTFNGWLINGETKNGGDIITVTQNITAYAQWTENRYTITYNLNGGQLPSDGVRNSFAIYNLPYVLPTPRGEDTQSFVKWTTDAAGENEITTITELDDYTLYAHYEDSAKFLTYKYSEALQGYEVTGYTGNGKSVKIPSTYKGVAVKRIGNSAFYHHVSLTSIEIPDSVTSIGDRAFDYCVRLTSIEIPDSVESIGEYAFYYCKSLKDVYITDIASWCNIKFEGVESNPLSYFPTEYNPHCIKNLYLNNEIITRLVIPDSVTFIGEYAFSGLSSLTSVEIPDSVESIGEFAFYNCMNLTSIEIPDSVTSIGNGAFYNCDSLTSVEIPDSVISIGSYAFYNCENLTSVLIGDSVKTIGISAFYNCDSLTEIVVPASVVSLDSSAFKACSNLKTWIIDSSYVANGDLSAAGFVNEGYDLGELLQDAIDVYIRADITITAGIYNVVFNNLGKETLDGVEYYHYQIKGE